ncbi:MAG TPA: glycosyltransferase family 2 protein [Noviherbaspirillum sp.]|nr:glycosyltransferase family 2 protein [Noviherbaspirillum sp.]
MKPHDPRVTVVMSAFNAEATLRSALESLRRQHFDRFEVVVVDDGSTDATADIARSWPDERVRLVQNVRHCGLAMARNLGIAEARGEYIALLDAHCCALPQRLAEQVAALDADPELRLVGSHLAVINAHGKLGDIWMRPTSAAETRIQMLFRDALSGVTFRKSAMPEGGFRALPAGVDFDFNARVAAGGKVCNLDRTLTAVRLLPSKPSWEQKVLAENCMRGIMRSQLRRFGVEASERELAVNRHVGGHTLFPTVQLLQDVEAWLLKLCLANWELQRYPDPDFKRLLGYEWYQVCKCASPLGREALRVWRSSPLLKHWQPGVLELARFVTKCLLRHERLEDDMPALA